MTEYNPTEDLVNLPEEILKSPEIQHAQQQFREASSKLRRLAGKAQYITGTKITLTELELLTEAGYTWNKKELLFSYGKITLAKNEDNSFTIITLHEHFPALDLEDCVDFLKNYKHTYNILIRLSNSPSSLGSKTALADYFKHYEYYECEMDDDEWYDD